MPISPDKSSPSSELAHYRRVLNVTGYVLFSANGRGYFTAVTGNVHDLTGYQAEELIGKHFTALVAPDWRDYVTSYYQRQFERYQEDAIFNDSVLEFPIHTRQGEVRWVEQTVLLVQEEGRYEFQAIVRDITTQKQMEDALQESEERYARLLEATFEAILIHKDSEIMDVNPGFERLMGYSWADVRGLTLDDIGLKRELLSTVDEADTFKNNETVVYARDGRAIPVEYRVRTITHRGEQLQAIALRDLTERKRVEQLYRAVVEDQTELICRYSPDGTLNFVNDAYCRFFHTSREKLLGSDFFELMPPAAREAAKASLQSLSPENPIHEGERRVVPPNSPPLWLSWVERGIFDPGGKLIEVQLVARDVTQQKHAEAELRRSETLYRTTARSLPGAAVLIFDRDLRYLLAEGEALTLQNLSKEKIEGKTVYDIVAPERIEGAVSFYRSALKGKTTTVEQTFGDIIAQLTVTPVYNEDGEIYAGLMLAQDITDRKRAEAELRRREALYRTTARNLPNSAVVIYNPDLEYILAEGPALAAMGRSKEEVEGKTIHDIVVPERLEDAIAGYRRVLAGGVEVVERNLEGRLYQLHTSPLHNEDGEIYAGLILIMDITERKQAEEALRASESRHRALVEGIPDLIFVITFDGVYIDCQADTDVRLLVQPEDLIGRNIRDIGAPPQVVEPTIAALKRAQQTGEVQTFQYPVYWPETPNTPHYYETRLVKMDDQHALILVHDVNDLKQAEEALRHRVEQLTLLSTLEADLVDQLDVEYVLTLAAVEAYRFSDADTAQIALITDENNQMRIVRTLGDYPSDAAESGLNDGEGIVSRVMRTLEAELVTDVSADPDYVPLDPDTEAQMAFPLVNQERLVGVLNLETHNAYNFTTEKFEFLQLLTRRAAAAIERSRLHTETERHLAELQVLYTQVSSLEQLKTDMLRIASHDLNNPLATVLGYTQLLNMSDIDGSGKAYVQEIEGAARRMQKITGDILSLERIEEMAQGETLYRISLDKLASESAKELRHIVDSKRQTLNLELQTDTHHVLADPAQLKEAVHNLIENAIKYTPEQGNITITIAAEKHTQNNRIVFRVTDSGIGVPQEQIDQLFQPFFRAKNARSQEGTGLGLNLVKRVIERHGGKMIVQSTLNVGSTFGFWLPAHQKPTS